MSSESSPVYEVVDLFAGAGGLSLGFDKPEMLQNLTTLGYQHEVEPHSPEFETILAVEKDEDARETFKVNFPNADVEEDVTDEDIDFSQWDSAKVVIGGPPCQGFSMMNQKKTEELDDERNQMWEYYMDVVDAVDPDVFLIENVPRFLQTEEGRGAYERASKEYGGDYDVIVTILEADDYGVPQNRKRAFMLGSKKGTPFFPAPTTSDKESRRTVLDAIRDLEYDAPSKGEREEGNKWHYRRNVGEVTKKRMEEVDYGEDRRAIPEDLLPECWIDSDSFTDCFGRLKWDESAATIRKGFYDPMKGRFVHPVANRSITIREGARFQTFPDEFEFATNAKTTAADQIGNAVPPKLAYELAKAIHAHLEFGVEGTPEEWSNDAKYNTAIGPNSEPRSGATTQEESVKQAAD